MSSTDNLWERVYALQATWPDEAALPDLAQLKADVDTLPAGGPERGLLRAYMAYHFCCGVTQSIDIESELRGVLKFDQTNTTARLHLGHWYYDCREYADAIRELEQVDVNEYVRAGQQWRAVKIQELLLAARLQCGRIEESLAELDGLLQKIRSTPPDELAVPTELVLALVEHREEVERHCGIERRKMLGLELRDTIDAVAGPEVLKEETAALTS